MTCKHHLYLEVQARTGSIKIPRPAVPLEEMEHSCVLDVADAGPLTLESIARMLNVTREAVRLNEGWALAALKEALKRHGFKAEDLLPLVPERARDD